MQKYLTINQVAEQLSVHPNYIRQHLTRFGAVDINQGESFNRCIRIPEKALEEYLNKCVILERNDDE